MSDDRICYQLESVPETPRGMATNKTRSCLCCRRIIAGQGGGGEYICQECHDWMRGGHASLAALAARGGKAP